MTSYPDGTPAETVVTGGLIKGELRTDKSGVAILSLAAGTNPSELRLKATDSAGRSNEARLKLEAQTSAASLMLRTNKAVYKVGERIQLDTSSTRQQGSVYIDVVKDGQTLITRAIDTSNGRGSLSLDLTPSTFGMIEVRAYQIGPDADPVSDRRLIYVDPADELRVEATVESECYKPGEEASISFRVTDKTGQPVSAALGIEIVDEAVFALSDKHPGFEKVFMYLEKELLTPRYEVHQFSFERVVTDDFDKETPLARERSAQVLLAAAGSITDRDVRSEFGREGIEAKRNEYAAVYYQKMVSGVQNIARAMEEFYLQHPSAQSFNKDVESFASRGLQHRRTLEDPWGTPMTGEGDIHQGASYISLRSAGPDKKSQTQDDLVIGLYAQRPTTAHLRQVTGKMTVQTGVVAGGNSGIQGSLKDDHGNTISGVRVRIQRVSNGRTVNVYSDSNGKFHASDLKPGNYRLSYEVNGFRFLFSRVFSLSSGERATVDQVLETRAISPISLSVYGYGSGRGRQIGAGGVPMGVFANRQVENLPLNGRAMMDLAMMQPAAAPEALAKRKASLRDESKDKKADVDDEASAAGPRVRSYFPETLYTNPALITDSQGRASISIPLADSITTWRISSLASTIRGTLGSSTTPLRVFQDFFVDLDLPVSVTEGDSLSVPVAVYNYLPTAQTVSLEVRQDPWFALEDPASRELDVKAGEVTVAYFRIKASKLGDQQLQVTARLKNGPAGQPGDAVARNLTVLPNGEEHAVVINERLEGSTTKELVIPEAAIADASKIFVKFYPGALSQVVEGLDSILQMPGGCFEQTSSSTYPNVLVMDYLKTSKKITPEIQAKAEGYISLGYQRLVTFEVPGGGFSWFGQAPANKILTAYGLMEFSDMSQVHEVDPRLISRTQTWLASQQQQDGSFKPDTYFINEGATNRYNTDVVRITAYIGWALASSGYKGEALEKAKQYVQSHLTGKEDAYTLAVIANFASDYGRDRAWIDSSINVLEAKAIETDKMAHWKQEGETPTSARLDSADLETTALAAQALLKSGQKSGLAKKALDYLTSKKDSMGNWQTTQATILSLKAFLLSFTKGASADTAGTIAVTVDGNKVETLQINKDNNDLLHMIDLKAHTHQGTHKISLSFEGRGSLQYQIVGRYYTPWAKRIDDGPREPLSIDVSYDRTRLAQDETATARVRVRNNTGATAKMIMVDLGIPPGFEAQSDAFESMMDSTRGKSGGRLEKYSITAKQVILYFDGLSPRQVMELSYKVRAKFPVKAQTFSSRIYEYYNPSVEDRTKPVEMTVTAR